MKEPEEVIFKANEDYQIIIANEPKSRAKLEEDLLYLQTLTYIQRRPEFRDFYLNRFETSHPQSKRLKSVFIVTAREALKKADYKTTASYMEKYLKRFPDGDYCDEYKLLLPQIKDFLELSKDVKF